MLRYGTVPARHGTARHGTARHGTNHTVTTSHSYEKDSNDTDDIVVEVGTEREMLLPEHMATSTVTTLIYMYLATLVCPFFLPSFHQR